MPFNQRRDKFASSSRSLMGSNVVTDQNQGGGNKKPGLPYIIGRSNWSTLAFNERGYLGNLKFMMRSVPMVNHSRPIGSTYTPNTYYVIPGTR
jgi:hypothetical protein